MHLVVIGVYLRSNTQQHSNSSTHALDELLGSSLVSSERSLSTTGAPAPSSLSADEKVVEQARCSETGTLLCGLPPASPPRPLSSRNLAPRCNRDNTFR